MVMEHQVHPVGSTGNSRAYVMGVSREPQRVEVELNVEAVGATPTATFTVQGLVPGGNPATASDWVNLALLQADSTVAASNAAVVLTTVGLTRRWIDGIDKRFFDAVGVNVTANTNVTYSTKLKVSPN